MNEKLRSMKDKWRGLFSLSVRDSEYFNKKEAKFELVSGCPKEGNVCINHLSAINKSFASSQNYHLNKDYRRSIESLKYAYSLTSELQTSSCMECAELFRSTIIQSLEYIHEDLQKMSSGLIFSNRYKPSYAMASQVLEEFRNEK